MEQFDSVTQVNIYPLKSAQCSTVDGQIPSSLNVAETGFRKYGVVDREFALVESTVDNDGNHLFVSQRGWDYRGKTTHKADRLLATVETDISPSALTFKSNLGSLAIDALYNNPDRYPYRDIRLHGSVLRQTIDQGDAPSKYFSRLLERDVRLVRVNRAPELRRSVSNSLQRPGLANMVAAADGAPFLLTSQESLKACHARNGLRDGNVPIDRYRANIVVWGAVLGAFGEDYVRSISIGEVLAEVTKPCARCPIPNIDQKTGEQVGQGLAVLRGRAGIFADNPGVYFGQNLNHKYAYGQRIGVGDGVSVLEKSSQSNVQLKTAWETT